MEKYRIKFSYEKIEGMTEQADHYIETCGFVIDMSSGIAEVCCVFKGDSIGEALRAAGEALLNGKEERLEKSIETGILYEKGKEKEIKRIRWVEED